MICSQCHLDLSEDQFYFRKDNKTFRKVCKKCGSIQKKMYRQQNLLKILAQKKEYYLKNKEKICQKQNNKAKLDRLKDPRKFAVFSSKTRAKQRGLEFNLKIADLNVPQNCPVLGIPLFIGNGKICDNSPSIDRIDNTKGYIPNNVIIVSYRVNSIKRDATIEELEKIVNFYKPLLK